MKNLKSGLIILGIFCLFEASSQAATSSEEERIGLSIANKLNSLLRPKIKSASRNFGWKKASRAGSQSHSLDFQLLLDSSGSIGAGEFRKALDATNVIVDFIHNKAAISPSGSRVALMEFSSKDKTKFVFGLKDRPYVSDVKAAVKNTKYDSGPRTATALALSKARTEFLQNGLSGNAKVVWILTDGKSNYGGNPATPADQLKTMGVTVCAVGVGNNVNMAEINAIASSGCVYKVISFSSYKRVMAYALKKGGGKPPAPVISANFFDGIKFNF